MKAWVMRALVLAAVAALLAGLGLRPAAAQDSGANRVSYNGVSFEFDPSLAYGVIAEVVPPDPPELEQPGGPTPGHLRFTLINRQGVEGAAFDVPHVWLFTPTDFASYPFFQAEFDALRGLLDERPDLASYTAVATDSSRNLPFLPVQAAAQVIRARPEYLEGAGWRGVSYLTAYRQDVSPFMASDFRYTLQALTEDGRYLAVSAPLQTSLFPAELPADFDYEAFVAGFEQYLADSVAALEGAGPEAFRPNLSVIESFVGSIGVEGKDMLGGGSAASSLEGTNWKLIGLGAPGAERPPVGEQPITLQFLADSRVGGSGGCNSYAGSYQIAGQTLSFSPLVSTLRACIPEELTRQESAFLAALQGGGAYQLEGNQLTITSADGAQRLVFEAMQ